MIKPRIQTLIVMNMKIVCRHIKLSSLFAIVAINVILLSSIREVLFVNLNILIGIATFNYLAAGFLFVNLFVEGKNEKIFYFMFPTDLKEIVLAKNISIFIIVFTLFCSAALVAVFLYRSSLMDFLDALTFFFTSIFLFFGFGNYISIRFKLQDSPSKVIISTVMQISIVLVVSLPYFTLKVLLQNYILCLIFSFFSMICWYFFMIPSASKAIQRYKFDILGDQP